MTKFLLMLSLMSCASRHNFIKHMTPTESPCVDGTLLNISKSSCVSLFWGNKDGKSDILKVRCTFAEEPSWWSATPFYITAIHHEVEISSNWTIFCADKNFVVYTGEAPHRLEENNESN